MVGLIQFISFSYKYTVTCKYCNYLITFVYDS